MAYIKPFKAVQPTTDKASLVVARSYENYSDEELKSQLDFNPFSFLHIINPGYKFQHEISGEQRFKLVKNRYLEFKEDGVLHENEQECYYLYKKITRSTTFCGIVAAAYVDDYENNVIKKHEDTIAFRERLFKEYLKEVGFNTEPVLLTYPDNEKIQSVVDKVQQKTPDYKFSTTNKETHFLWRIEDANEIAEIQAEFEKMPALYIADGHHRSASSALLAKECQERDSLGCSDKAYNFFMSYLIPESNLKIYEFHRIIKDLNGLSKEEFLIQLDKDFRIENRGLELYKPSKKHHFSMYLDGEYYSLYLRKINAHFTNSLSKLDTYILYDRIIKPVLGIDDVRNDKRISYIDGKNDSVELKARIDSGEYAVGFGMMPITVEEMKQIADEGLTMPPKSTYIEPKMLNGLYVYEF